MKCQVHFLIAVIILLKGSFVYAQMPGSWLLRTGAITVSPQVTSGCLSAPDFSDSPDGCTKAGVSRNTQLGGGITWIMSQHLSLDMPLALPFTHEVSGEGAMKGSGTIAEIQSLPLTLFPQYRFFGSRSMFRPYFGLGVTYAYFFNPQGSGRLTATTNPGGEPTTFTVDSKFIFSPQVGASLRLYRKFYADVFYSQAKLRSRIHMSTGQHLDADLDPQTFGLAVGYAY
ncbi:MAG TPA: OmpW family outer membrane protein [Oligoflexus sp.]|uniref:OmpW/AlkL family protein n=1 Tax=Oligoflexus sp. TaxID=1971216 RepID=UPI002D2DC556|nr:OmpW family outer membrane protein [Oligoflexus sp.]HYX35002.1 OmpW family outer membrane protein [Oligoflexus sp.]